MSVFIRGDGEGHIVEAGLLDGGGEVFSDTRLFVTFFEILFACVREREREREEERGGERGRSAHTHRHHTCGHNERSLVLFQDM